MKRYLMPTIVLVCLLGVAFQGLARTPQYPAAGYPTWKAGLFHYASLGGAVWDSVRAPAGYKIERVDIYSLSGQDDTLLVGFVVDPDSIIGPPLTDTPDMMRVMGNAKGAAPAYRFYPSCAKAYFMAQPDAGVVRWSWMVYFLSYGTNSGEGVTGVTVPTE